MANTGFTETHGACSSGLAIPQIGTVLTDGGSNYGVDVGIASKTATSC